MNNVSAFRYYTATLPLASLVGVSSIVRLATEAWAFASLGSHSVAAFACTMPLMFVSSGVLYGLSLSALSLAKSGCLAPHRLLLASLIVSFMLAILALAAGPIVTAVLEVEGEVLRQSRLLLTAYAIMLIPMGSSVALGALLKHHGYVRWADSITLVVNLSFVLLVFLSTSYLSEVDGYRGVIRIAAIGLLVASSALIMHLMVISRKNISTTSPSSVVEVATELTSRSIPLAGANLLAGVYMLAIGRIIADTGGENALAALGLVLRAEQIVLVGVSVVTMTAMPLLSSQWHAGAGRRRAFKSAAALSASWGAAAGVALVASANYMQGPWTGVPAASVYLSIAPLVFVAVALHATASATWAVADRRKLQIYFSVFRLFFVGLIPLVLVCTFLGVSTGLAWIGLASVLSAPLAIQLAWREIKRE